MKISEHKQLVRKYEGGVILILVLILILVRRCNISKEMYMKLSMMMRFCQGYCHDQNTKTHLTFDLVQILTSNVFSKNSSFGMFST